MLDLDYMNKAISLAKRACAKDEVPVGALIVHNGKIIARGYNKRESSSRATAHAEIIAIEQACKKLRSWRLCDCTLYVTLEPCPMCAGAIINARIPRVVFGAYDPKAGAFGSVYDLSEGKLNHKPEIVGNILGKECGALLSDYFKQKRLTPKSEKALFIL